jgi:hypothetical protein
MIAQLCPFTGNNCAIIVLWEIGSNFPQRQMYLNHTTKRTAGETEKLFGEIQGHRSDGKEAGNT